MDSSLEEVVLKLKQASAVLGVSPKQLQNLVQFGVVRPRRRHGLFWFDYRRLLEAKIALLLKATLRPSTEILAKITKQVSQLDQPSLQTPTLLVIASPGMGRPKIQIRLPLREIWNEIEEGLPSAQFNQGITAGRQRTGWKEEFLQALQQAGHDVGEMSEQEITRRLRAYRRSMSARKKQTEITVLMEGQETA